VTCDPLSAIPCPAKEGCYFDYHDEWAFICQPAGTDGAGEFCWSDEYNCQPGFDCVLEGEIYPGMGMYYGYCEQLCALGDDAACPVASSCEPMPDVGTVGYCELCEVGKECGAGCCESYQSCVAGACVNNPYGIDAMLGTFNAIGVVDADSPHILMEVPIPSSDGTPDVLQIELYDSVLTTGTFALGVGAEANYQTCNKCVRLFARNASNKTVAGYFATGGTLHITSVTGGIFATLTDVTFEQVEIDSEFRSTPHPSGCKTFVSQANVRGSSCDPARVCGGSCCGPTQYCDNAAVPNKCFTHPVPPNNACSGYTWLTVDGAPISGTTIGASADYGMILSPACQEQSSSYAGRGSEVVYRLDVLLSGIYRVTVTPSSSYDCSVWVAHEVCGVSGTPLLDSGRRCVAASDVGGKGAVQVVDILPTGGMGTYYIFVDSYYPDEAGDFTIQVERFTW